jgi:5-formyltetrahydrofolate cyclo-ligase
VNPDRELGDPEALKVLRVRAKIELRKRARGVRSAIPKEAVAARSEKIVRALAALGAVRRAQHVALFFPILSRNEVDLRTLDAELRAEQKALYYPAIEDDSRDAAAPEAASDLEPGTPGPRRMTFRRVVDVESMRERGQGFLDPGPDAPEAEALDVIIVPGLAFDPRGYRIGYGAGYYDRTLPRFCPPALAIGVAFDFQLAPDLPATETDVPVDRIITDLREIVVG